MSTSDSKVELPPTAADPPVVPVPEKLPMSRARRQKLAADMKTREAKPSGLPKPTPPGAAAPSDPAAIETLKSPEPPPPPAISDPKASAPATPPAAPGKKTTKPPARTKPAPPAKPAASKKPNASKEATPAEESDADEDTAEPSPSRWIGIRRFLGATPSWLVSTIVHLAAIILLAMFTITPDEKLTAFFITGNPAEDAEPTLIEPTTFTAEMKNTSDISSSSPTSEALGFSDVGDVSEAAQSTAALGAGELEMSPVGEIGDVFGSKGQGMSSTNASGHTAEFFGVKATGRKFVFIVDSSNSMRVGKFADAKQELMYALMRLNKEQFFYVIFFDHDAERMRLFPNKEPEEKAVRATIENIKRVEQWVNTVENERKTDPYDAVKFAVEMLPDAIYLLTDGIFTDKGQTIRYLKDHNIIDEPVYGKRAKVVIHTVGFYSKDGEENLKIIAKAYGGTYRFVPKPEKKK